MVMLFDLPPGCIILSPISIRLAPKGKIPIYTLAGVEQSDEAATKLRRPERALWAVGNTQKSRKLKELLKINQKS